MNYDNYFEDFLKAKDYKLSLCLGEFVLELMPLGSGKNSIVYKAKLNDKEVALKFIIRNDSMDLMEPSNELKKNHLLSSLLATRSNLVQYIDFDLLKLEGVEIPVQIMRLYKCSLKDYRSSLSPEIFVKLFHFLTNTIHFLHSQGVSHRNIKPENILIDDQLDFALSDLTNASPDNLIIEDISAIGKILKWYVFGDMDVEAEISSVFPGLKMYDEVIRRCLTSDVKKRFSTVEDILVYVDKQKEHDPEELKKEFNLICRKNFPRELPGFVHCTDQKKIVKLISNFISKIDFFGNHIVYFTDINCNAFSPCIGENGYYKFDNFSQYKVLDIWIYCDENMNDDYILIHHANTIPEKVYNKETYKWAVFDKKMPITWHEGINGYAEIEGDIIALDTTKIEFFNRIPREGYVFVALNHYHNLTLPCNINTLRDYFFRFSFSHVNRLILEDMNTQTRQHQAKMKK